MGSQRRIAALALHFPLPLDETSGLVPVPTSAAVASVDPEALYLFLTRDNVEMRQAIFEFLKDPLYKPNYYLSLTEFRALTSARVSKFVAAKFFSVSDYLSDPLRFQAALECLSFCDYSLAIKSGVHFTLCGGTIAKLGTAKHHRAYLPKMDSLELPGCFGMTELGHGSNVMGIETTAVYDPSSSEFVINTPNNEASKYWIGGAAQTAKICAVFAQLTVGGQWQGPHVFVVHLRDAGGALMPGVRIADNGPKMGLNGVDNGQIWFDAVRVPRDALLDRYAQVDERGQYHSAIPSVSQRFGTMIGGLTTGRMLIGQAAVDACKVGVTIAVRYGCQRPQFGDRAVMSYVTHQRRLLPALATTFAMHLAMLKLKETGLQGGAEAAKTVHVLSSGLKAAATWHRTRILQDCRECCGGMGFLAANKIGPLLTDMNVDVTFEGDNTVLMQQVAKPLLDAAAAAARSGPPAPPRVNELALGPGCVAALLAFRQAALTAEVGAHMGGGGKAAAAAFDANLDRVTVLGWAYVDAASHATFAAEAEGAPAALRPALGLLCQLYGLHRVEEGLETYLAAGALSGAAVAPLRAQVNALCAALAAEDGRLARQLCAGFGVPDYLLAAPIAAGWRDIGA